MFDLPDYAQAEAVILSKLTDNPSADRHTVKASEMFSVPVEEVTSLQRRAAKRANVLSAYSSENLRNPHA